MNATDLYASAYRLLDSVTPLKYDCGKLCGAACCDDGGREDAGMYLYYGEEQMLKDAPFPLRIEESCFEYGDYDKKALIAICDGKCRRDFRPLSCRIFPLIPYKREGEKLKIIIDPRARQMCPLARAFELSDFDKRFTARVSLIFKVLSKNKYINDFIVEQSYLLDEIKDMANIFK